jgi:phosphoenolpyruvate carboxylase
MESWWQAVDRAKRLRELTTCDPQEKEFPLRRDVRSLGLLLGEASRAQAGMAVFQPEEQLLQLAIGHRELAREAEVPADGTEHELLAGLATR